MSIYPPNTTLPKKGLNYLWNYLGTSLKAFAGVLKPYLKPKPGPADYLTVYSYGRYIYGLDNWSAGSKWATIAAEVDPTDYLNLKLVGGIVNGVPINREYQEVTVNHTNLVFRDDGYGLFPVNYVDFINGILEQYGIYTRIKGTTNNPNPSPSATGQPGFIANYCVIDDFTLVFVETGQLDGGPTINSLFYTLQADYGLGLRDVFWGIGSPITINGYNSSLHYLMNTNIPQAMKWYQSTIPV